MNTNKDRIGEASIESCETGIESVEAGGTFAKLGRDLRITSCSADFFFTFSFGTKKLHCFSPAVSLRATHKN